MAEIFLHKREVRSVFHLLGEKENDITCSVAWGLAQSPRFLDELVRQALGLSADNNGVVIRLQQHEQKAGITDIEIESPGQFFIIVEAKRGWNLPGLKQFRTYARRASFRSSDAATKRILLLSECSREYALQNLGFQEIAGIGVQPISWKEMAMLAAKAQKGSSHSEKRLLRELLIYLRGLMNMQNADSNRVWVVALGGKPKGSDISYIDIVEKRSRYFHPVGGKFPKEPPNYIAFRYGGKLQSVHHIESSEVFTDPHAKFPEIPDRKWDPCFLYTLGPAFAPSKDVRTGRIYRSGRVWCMLDTLFTSKTISQARDISKKRANEGE